mmetsp:Transcript_15645/g.59475  ORF Transcript_15645/g.59475 Transcript_15645/m.59475 type:complete len:202 (+) Transcript_15645:1568-2173(+)
MRFSACSSASRTPRKALAISAFLSASACDSSFCAISKAVFPSESLMLISLATEYLDSRAPSVKNRTASAFPWKDPQCRQVHPSLSVMKTSAPLLMSCSSATRKSPFRPATTMSGDQRSSLFRQFTVFASRAAISSTGSPLSHALDMSSSTESVASRHTGAVPVPPACSASSRSCGVSSSSNFSLYTRPSDLRRYFCTRPFS